VSRRQVADARERIEGRTEDEVRRPTGEAARLQASGLEWAEVQKPFPEVRGWWANTVPTHTDEGLRAAYEIRLEYPEVGILVLSQYGETAYVSRLMAEGAEGLGYLLKDRVSDVADWRTRCAGSAPEDVRSTRSSSADCWGASGRRAGSTG